MSGPTSCRSDVELAAYFVVSEALTNASKYAAAGAVRIRVAREDGVLLVEVADDGRGGADAAGGTGLRGLADRIDALGGRFEVDSPPGAGTRVSARCRCGADPRITQVPGIAGGDSRGHAAALDERPRHPRTPVAAQTGAGESRRDDRGGSRAVSLAPWRARRS